MIRVEAAIRGWVDRGPGKRATQRRKPGWRSGGFGERVLVFDTETTTDHTQRLLYGFARVYVYGELMQEICFVSEDLSEKQLELLRRWVRRVGIALMTREAFIHEVFYPEVYELGALCVGFNLPFDLTRIAESAGPGRSRRGKKAKVRHFSVQLSRRVRWPRLHIEAASSKAAFIKFVPKLYLAGWEKPFFAGRFLDLSTLAAAFSGGRLTLARACEVFSTADRKSEIDELGKVTIEALAYGRRDVLVTWQLYEKLLAEYLSHPFATLDNELAQAKSQIPVVPITRIYSAASIAKAYFAAMGIRPLLQKQPRFSRELLGYAAASYFGGRAECRVRRISVPVTVVDFTSMYPTVSERQELQALLTARRLRGRKVTKQVRQLLHDITLDDLYNPATWLKLRVLVRIKPDGDILPVRMRLESEAGPYAIALGPYTTDHKAWYTLADVIASKLFGGPELTIEEAIEFYSDGPDTGLTETVLGGRVTLDPKGPMFQTIVEERQKAKAGKSDPSAGSLDMALKIMANSGAYGIFYEVNVSSAEPAPGMVYSDEAFESNSAREEVPGKYCNPIIASLVTGGARLMLAMLETEVVNRGGTYAYCDTDSLAVVTAQFDGSIPSIRMDQIEDIIHKFDRLSPYDPSIVPHMLKIEQKDVLCWAISTKRYCLYTVDEMGKRTIVKASESGLGGIITRSNSESVKEFSHAVWAAILDHEIDGVDWDTAFGNESFNGPLRRKYPLTQPSILSRDSIRAYNAKRTYRDRLKPFSFIQTVTQSVTYGEPTTIIGPFEKDLARSKWLPWIDLNSGSTVRIDWGGNSHADSIEVISLAEYIESYADHPEAKAADSQGMPSRPETKGLLFRLDLKGSAPVRIGKEVDRLDDDGDVLLESFEPLQYGRACDRALADAIAVLQTQPQAEVAAELELTVRRWRDILKGHARPRDATTRRIVALAARHRDGGP